MNQSIRPYNETIVWDTAIDAMPAWLMSISGEDLGSVLYQCTTGTQDANPAAIMTLARTVPYSGSGFDCTINSFG